MLGLKKEGTCTLFRVDSSSLSCTMAFCISFMLLLIFIASTFRLRVWHCARTCAYVKSQMGRP